MENTWIRYVDRSYQQIKSQVITIMQARVPEITDHSESNIFVKMLSIWSAIAEMLGYYTDNVARESHLDSARLYASHISKARTLDYPVKSSIPATVDIEFTLNVPAPSAITIPANTRVRKTGSAIDYFTSTTIIIPIGATVGVVSAKQRVEVVGAAVGIALGTESEEIVIGTSIANDTAILIVNGTPWTPKLTLAFSLGADEHFVQSVNKLQETVFIVGNDFNAKKLTAGDTLTANYYVTDGLDGNVAASTITTIVSTITLPVGVTITCNNPNPAVGGQDVETMAQLKKRIPLSIRTMWTAVTRYNYRDIAELAAGVARAKEFFNCGKTVDIYIVPDGGGIATALLCSDTETWFDDKREICVPVRVKPAGTVHVQLIIDLRVLPQYVNASTAALVADRLVVFGSVANQEIMGTMQLSDVYETIEETTGVKHSNIVKMTPVPYARPLGSNVYQLLWTRVVNIGSTVSLKWVIRVIIGGVGAAASYEIIRNNVYLGTFNPGTAHSFSEINFTVSNVSTYTTGQQWEFYTYPFYGTLELLEPSIPIIELADISISATGGI